MEMSEAREIILNVLFNEARTAVDISMNDDDMIKFIADPGSGVMMVLENALSNEPGIEYLEADPEGIFYDNPERYREYLFDFVDSTPEDEIPVICEPFDCYNDSEYVPTYREALAHRNVIWLDRRYSFDFQDVL